MSAPVKHFKFLQRIQQYVGQNINILSKDIEYFLNKGQDIWVNEIYDKFRGQEEFRKRLNTITSTVSLNNGDIIIGPGIHGGILYEVPNDALYILDESVNTANPVPVKPVDVTYYNKQIKNPFKSPNSKVIWRMEAPSTNSSTRHELIAIGVVINSYNMTYIRYPRRIDLHSNPQVDTDISEMWEDEIVDKAVEIAYQTYSVSGSLRTNEK